MTRRFRLLMLVAALMLAVACGGGGGGSSPTSPSSTQLATVTITASGVEPKILSVSSGAVVRFVNNDSRSHQILTTPHVLHTDCPPINAVDMLTPGQSKTTEAMITVRICGFHDHMLPDDTRFRGQINVGTNEGPEPVY